MMYALPILILAMMIYMFWHAGFSMRRDRILGERAMRRMRLVADRMRRRPRIAP
jgi:hypothetical protein